MITPILFSFIRAWANLIGNPTHSGGGGHTDHQTLNTIFGHIHEGLKATWQ